MTTPRLLALALLMFCGCTFRFGSHDSARFSSRLAAEGSTPELQACGRRLSSLQAEYDKYAGRSEWLLWGGALTGAITVGIAAYTAKDTPGDGAMDVPAAVAEEKGVSTVELITIGVASVTALSEGLSGVFAVIKGNRLKSIQDVRGIIDRLEAGETVSQSDLITICHFQPATALHDTASRAPLLADRERAP